MVKCFNANNLEVLIEYKIYVNATNILNGCNY